MFLRRYILHAYLLIVTLVLTACGGSVAAPPAPEEPTAQQSADIAIEPTVTPGIPTQSAQDGAADELDDQELAALSAELQTLIAAELPPPPTPDDSGYTYDGIEGSTVLEPVVQNGQRFWPVHTHGVSPAGFNHFLALYTRTADAWQEIDRVTFSSFDALAEDSVESVDVFLPTATNDPDWAWFELQTLVGVNNGVYELLSFDGLTLVQQVRNANPSPTAGRLADDLNGDGIREVVLQTGEPYLFCRACGILVLSPQIVRWEGSSFTDVVLTPLSSTTPEELRAMMDEALVLAEADLWAEAERVAGEARALNTDVNDTTATWNILQIEQVAQERGDIAARDGEYDYPLAANLFYGDYPAIMEILRAYSPTELFSTTTPLVVGTATENWRSEFAAVIVEYTTRALAARPDLASAYFLRGWGHYLANPANSEALADVQQAAQLQPGEALFTESAAYLQSGILDIDDAAAVQAAAQVYVEQRTGESLPVSVTIEKLEGDFARVLIDVPGQSTGPLRAFLRRENGVWTVIAEGTETGTGLDIDSYRRLGIPEELLSDLGVVSANPEADPAVVDAVTDYVRNNSVINDFSVEVWVVEGDYAYARTIATDNAIAPATVWLAYRAGQWTVLSMGAAADPEELRDYGMPEWLIMLQDDLRAATTAYFAGQPLPELSSAQVVRVADTYARVLALPTDSDAAPIWVFLQRQSDAWAVLDVTPTPDEAFFEAYTIPPALHNVD